MKSNKVMMLVSAALFSGSVFAAGANDFTGAYAGVSLGIAQGNATVTEYNGTIWDYGEYTLTSGLKANYGVQFGYDMAVGNGGIVGVELAYDRPDISLKRDMFPGANPYKIKADWKGDIGLRFKGGLVSDKTLFYALVGVVQQKVDFAYGDPNDPNNYLEESESSLGLSYGIGMEAIVADHITVRGQLVVNDTESQKETYQNDPFDLHSASKAFTIGVNYRF